MPVTPKVGFRLSAETRERIAQLAEQREDTATGVVEAAVREMAERAGIRVAKKKAKSRGKSS